MREGSPSLMGSAGLFASRRLLQHTLEHGRQAFPPELDLLSRYPHLIASTFVLATFDAQLVPLNAPFTVLLLAHRIRCQAAVRTKNIGPMRIITHFHSN